jgi:hypothetical protein
VLPVPSGSPVDTAASEQFRQRSAPTASLPLSRTSGHLATVIGGSPCFCFGPGGELKQLRRRRGRWGDKAEASAIAHDRLLALASTRMRSHGEMEKCLVSAPTRRRP